MALVEHVSQASEYTKNAVPDLLTGLPESFQPTDYVFEVVLNEEKFLLPIAVINPNKVKEEQIAIAYLNPERPGLAEAIAAGMVDLIEGDQNISKNELLLLIGPPTNKSGGINTSLKNKLRLKRNGTVDDFRFPGGRYQETDTPGQYILPDFPGQFISPDKKTGIFQTTDSNGKKIVGICYEPVTGKKKYLLLTQEQIRSIAGYFENEEGKVILVEDVVTTGATVKTMSKMLTDFCSVPENKITVVAAAKEGNAGLEGINLKYLVQLPEWEVSI